MIKITLEPAIPKNLVPKRPFKLNAIKLSFKIAGLSVLSNNRDFFFKIEFKNAKGSALTQHILLPPPYFYNSWESDPFDISQGLFSKDLFDKIIITSNANNGKALILEIDLIEKINE